jgi:hypothetical protein
LVVGKVQFLVVATAKPLKFGLLVVKKENMVVGEVENGKKKKAMGNDDGKEVEMCKDDKGDKRVVRVVTKGVLQFPTKEEEGVKGGEKGTFSQ